MDIFLFLIIILIELFFTSIIVVIQADTNWHPNMKFLSTLICLAGMVLAWVNLFPQVIL